MTPIRSLVVALAMAPLCSAARGESFYVSPLGDDANIGTSADAPWRTLDKINSLTLRAGDRVLFEGGTTFQGGIFVGPEDSGTPQSPVFFGSYGQGRATISAGGSAFSAQSVSGLEIANLAFQGIGASANAGRGINLYNDGPVRPSYVRIRDVEVSGFRGSGISIGALPGAVGYRDVRITGAVLHDNGEAGLSTWGPSLDTLAPAYAHEDVIVSGVLAYNNTGIPGETRPTGSGISLGSVNGALIERSVARDNGRLNSSPTGPVGIWTYDANGVVIQHNRSYNNSTGWNGIEGGDGGGYDLDRNTSNSVLQYNFAFGNDGPGLMAYADEANDRHAGNVIRYNISHADGRRNGYGGIVLLGALRDINVHNNTVLFPGGAAGLNPAALKVGGVGGINPRVRIANNIFQTGGGGNILIAPDDPDSIRLLGNDYWAADGSFRLLWGDDEYLSLQQWLAGTPVIERDGSGRVIARGENPQFSGKDGQGGFAGVEPTTSLNVYRLMAGSPLVDGAFDTRVLGLHPGAVDLFGTPIAQGNAYDLGAGEQAFRVWLGRSSQNLWTDPANWLPGGPPLTGDSAVLSYSGAGDHAVTYANPDATTRIHLFRLDAAGDPSGRISFLHGQDELSTAVAEIGYDGRATYEQTGGVHRAGTVILGHNPSAQGRYAMAGGEFTATNLLIGFGGRGEFSATGGVTRTAEMILGGVSATGVGTFEASGSALVETGRLQVGAAGNLDVRGEASVLAQDAWVRPGGVIELSGGSFTSNINLRISGEIRGTGKLTSAGIFINEGRVHLGPQSPAAPTVATATFSGDVILAEGSEFRVDEGSSAVFLGRVSAGQGISVFTGSGDKTFGAGSVAELGPVDTEGSTIVRSGASVTVDRLRERALNVEGEIKIRPAGGHLGTSSLRTLGLGETGRMDLADHGLILDYDDQSPLDSISDAIASAYRGVGEAAWTGPGLTSSVAAADARTGLGYAEAADVLSSFPGSFLGTEVDETAVLVRITLLGDADLDGIVSTSDFVRLQTHFGQGATWAEGDFNYDGTVTFADFQILEQNFGGTFSPIEGPVGGPSAQQTVPEPCAAALLAAWFLVITNRLRRRHQRANE